MPFSSTYLFFLIQFHLLLFTVSEIRKDGNNFSPIIPNVSRIGNVIIFMIGGFIIGMILLIVVAYIAKRRRQYKDHKKEIIREKYLAVDDKEGSNTPLQSNEEEEM